MTIHTYYLSPKPSLTIENRGGRSLGNCYSASYYKVTSLHALSMEDLKRLRESGFLGYGQEFMCKYVTKDGAKVAVPATLDWRTTKDVVPTGHDTVGGTLVEEETWKVIGPASTDQNERTSEMAYYVYECESRVDSSD